jgi:hypothetical protein
VAVSTLWAHTVWHGRIERRIGHCETLHGREIGAWHVWVRAIWHGRIVRPGCHWDTLSDRVLGDWLSQVLASGHTSWHGLNKPRVSHWDVLLRCDGSTVHWPTVDGGAICAAIGTHGVVAGEVVGAVVSSTREELEGVAAEVVSHCEAVWVV